jgi:NTE family protein
MPKIGLALGGGGAKGFAHVGVLRALEELNIYADILTGTSMGGLIAAMYAAGLSVDRIEAVLRATSLAILAARERSGLGLVGRAKIVRWLDGILGDVTFDQLQHELAVVAVDLESGCEVILDSGKVIEALLATTAFPGVFAPVLREGHYLVDGGALNNVPFDVARRLGADRVIACDVTLHRHPLFQIVSLAHTPAEAVVQHLLFRTGAAEMWEVVDRTLAIMQDGCLKAKLAACPPDVMICPEVGHVGLFEIHQFESCLAAGMAAVQAHQAELISLRDQAKRAPKPLSFWDRMQRLVTGRTL